MSAPPALLKPGLYSQDGTTSQLHGPSLKGATCVCGNVFFPYQDFGCESCGRHGEDIRPSALSGTGRILSLAKVHLHAGKGRQAPFTVAMIELDDGPTIRTLLDAGSEAAAAPGSKVVATLEQVTSGGGEEALDLRFTLQR